jgi:geranylgeranyl diphosphate synthase, type II
MSRIVKFQEQVETALSYLMTDREPSGLYEPVSYILSLGGKRLRPALCLTACAMFNESEVHNCMSPAIGLEVFHNFTLLHDDVMDKSAIRRNHPTVHEKWNVNTAILSGDAMMIKAYQLVAQSPADILPKVIEIFNRTAMEVCEGQQYDMDFESRNDVTEAQYIEMIRLKTAVLVGTSLQVGAILGRASKDDAAKLYQFGTDIGISFQLQDDWLDVFGDSDTFGKSIGGDIANNKKTFLLINALNNLLPSGKRELESWLAKKEFDREEKINAIRNLYEDANVSVNAKKMMDAYYRNSLESLNQVNGPQEIKEDLAQFANQLMERSR